MIRLGVLLFLLAVEAAGTGAGAPRGKVQRYGRPLAGLPATTLGTIVQDPDRYKGRTVRLEGAIAEVCQAKGCWIELRQGDHTIHVTFAGESFVLPADVTGRKAAVEGRLVPTPPRADELRAVPPEGGGEFRMPVALEATGVEVHLSR